MPILSSRNRCQENLNRTVVIANKSYAPNLTIMNVRLNVAIASFVVVCAFPGFAGLRLEDGEICFCNKSTNKIVVTHVLSDGKESILGCGILIPNGCKSFYDENMFPSTIPQNFQIQYEDSQGITHTDKLDTAWVKPKKAKDGKICFIFTPEQKFILKIYLDTGGDSMRLDGMLLPDEENPAFKSYKELIRASIDGNAQRVQELLTNGVPYVWPNDPVSLTPLEWSVRWDRKEAFDVLMHQLPKDFYPYSYYWGIQIAAQEGHTYILKRLLQSDLAKDVPQASLQEIFYNACSHAKVDNAKTNDVEVLKILLERFKVGIDYKTRDYGHTLLFVAVDSDDVELVRWLLAQGANPSAKLQNGNTPLNRARSETVRKLLIDHGGQ
jgi:hypothetical protein